MSKELFYTIAEDVFAQFPGYRRGVVIAYDVKNGESPPEILEMLRQGEASLREKLDIERLTEHPRIASWREAYRSFGAKPSKFRSSIEAMTRRALRNQELPGINALVDIGNALSLKYLVPTGGHAIDEVTGDLSLRPALGGEEFVPFGSDVMEHPDPGEIVFVEGDMVLTRRWSWRQANHTLTLPTTTAIEFNVDGLPPVPRAEVEEICGEVMTLIKRFCGGEMRYEVITEENPRIRLSR
ncbi:MAG: phenylalanine--tRNA ligase beta subunit-related protein [Pseudomonadota bacterium]